MAAAYIHPADNYDDIQNTVDNFDEVIFSEGTYDIGTETIKVTKPTKIRGDNKGKKPKIIGSCGRLIWDQKPPMANSNCGVFSISAVSGAVEITGLHIEHIADPNPADANAHHGSSTIACYVDNTQSSSLIVTDCDIDSSATGAINIESINECQPEPVKHDFIISRCTINGLKPGPPHPLAATDEGNWISVRLGPMASNPGQSEPTPIDMRGSYFEVSDCFLYPAKFTAVAVWICLSDSQSRFVILNNEIAPAPTLKLDFGVFFGYWDLFQRHVLAPKGSALIVDNKIVVNDCFELAGLLKPSAAGISVVVDALPSEPLNTFISHNSIRVAQPLTATPIEYGSRRVAGISYEDLAPGGSANATAVIERNVIDNKGNVDPTDWGIYVCGSAHDVVVQDNDMISLTAYRAQVEVDGSNCMLARNELGRIAASTVPTTLSQQAALLCKGSHNSFLHVDFSKSHVPGWSLPGPTDGPGCIKLDSLSTHNLVIYEVGDFPVPQPGGPTSQCWNEGTYNELVNLPRYEKAKKATP